MAQRLPRNPPHPLHAGPRAAAGAVLLLLALLLPAGPLHAAGPPGDDAVLEEARAALHRAESWYWLARTTANDLAAHEEASRHYETALTLLEGAGGEPAAALRIQAQAGRDQTDARILNAYDTYRSVLRSVWWMAGNDPTLVTHGGPEMVALGNAMAPVLTMLTRASFLAPRLPVLVRARADVSPAELEAFDISLPALRDEVLKTVDEDGVAWGISDDHGIALLGNAWRHATDPDTPLHEAAGTVGEALGVDRLIVVDITVSDLFHRHAATRSVPIRRIDATGTLWDIRSGQPVTSTTGRGFSQHVNDRLSLPLLWAALMFLLSIALVLFSWRSTQPHERTSLPVTLGLGLLVFAGGMSISSLTSEISAAFVPDWGFNVFLLEFERAVIPHPTALLWALVHGALVLLSPLLALAWMTLRISRLFPSLIDARIQPERLFSLVGPFAQAGASTALFSTVILAEPGSFTGTALPLGVAACLCGTSLARPLADLLAAQRDNTPRLLLASALGSIGLLALMPFGLFLDWAWPTGLVVLGMAAAATAFAREEASAEALTPQHASSTPADNATHDDLLLFREDANQWVDLIPLDEVQTYLEAGRHVAILPPEGTASRSLGTTFAAATLLKRLEGSSLPPEAVLHVHCGDAANTTNAYGVVSHILKRLGCDTEDLSRLNERAATTAEAAQGVGELLAELPLLGSILGFLPAEESDSDVQQEWINTRGAKLLRAALERKGIRCLVLEDFHTADPASVELLEYAYTRSTERPRTSLLLCLHEPAHRPEIKQLLNNLECTRVHPRWVSDDDTLMHRFLETYGIKPPEEAEEVARHLCQFHAPQVIALLRALYREGHLIPAGDGTLRVQKDQSAARFLEALPELATLLEEQVRRLSPEQQELLQAAALCGSPFAGDEVAAGLGWSTLRVASVAEELEALEVDPPVADIEDRPGLYRFHSPFLMYHLREALDDEKDTRLERARTIHERILLAPAHLGSICAARRFYHGLRAGDAPHIASATLHQAASILEHLVQQRAWTDLRAHLDQIKRLRGLGQPEDEARIDLAECRWCEHQPEPEVRLQVDRIAAKRLTMRLRADQEDRLTFALAQLLCETLHQLRENEKLVKRCQDLRELARSTELICLFTFHEALTTRNAFPNKDTSADARLCQELRSLQQRLAAGPTAPAMARETTLLHSMILTSLASPLQRTGEEVGSLLDQAESLKKRIGDDKGLAIVYGQRGNQLLFPVDKASAEDLEQALKWFQKDKELIESRGLILDRSSLLNRMSTACLGLALRDAAIPSFLATSGQELQPLVAAANYAEEAFRIACELQRSTDIAFAAAQCLAVWNERRRRDGLDPAADALIDEIVEKVGTQEFWRDPGKSFARENFVKEARHLLDARPEHPRSGELRGLLETLESPSSADSGNGSAAQG